MKLRWLCHGQMEVSAKIIFCSEKLRTPWRYGLVMNRRYIDAKLDCTAGAIRPMVVVRMLCDSIPYASVVVGSVVICC